MAKKAAKLRLDKAKRQIQRAFGLNKSEFIFKWRKNKSKTREHHVVNYGKNVLSVALMWNSNRGYTTTYYQGYVKNEQGSILSEREWNSSSLSQVKNLLEDYARTSL